MPPRPLGYATIAVLHALADGARFGFDIVERTGLASGTAYPALATLERRGLVRSEWERDETARAAARPRRRYYRVTAEGTVALREAVQRFGALPLAEFAGDTRIYAATRPPESNADWRYAQIRQVTEGYFEAIGIRLLRGRNFDTSDRDGPVRTVLINQTLADQFFPGEDPVGQGVVVGFAPVPAPGEPGPTPLA